MGPLKADEVRATHITVSWKRPEDNGGTEITGYILEKMDMDTGRWVSTGEVKYNDHLNIVYCVLLKLIIFSDWSITRTIYSN